MVFFTHLPLYPQGTNPGTIEWEVLCSSDQVCHLILHLCTASRDIGANYEVPEEILQENMKSLETLY
jgi:hypothetical protein